MILYIHEFFYLVCFQKQQQQQQQPIFYCRAVDACLKYYRETEGLSRGKGEAKERLKVGYRQPSLSLADYC